MLYRDIMPMIDPVKDEKGNYNIFIVNDLLTDVKGSLMIILDDLQNKNRYTTAKEITAKASSSKLVFSITSELLKNYEEDNLVISA